ncbi:putative dihydroorotate dehydrogenase A (fumarate) [Hypsizygus marmoreus]|uniref:Dihydroorotate oxidase n=1 Tax=Hypsizygus marmoreus TaxID=39966 RepID=A0A369KBJ7_HYPMA|nr:putative dihydroorotate dehydrogenase A (fumarate) [Hypsizygus marmoreus]
MVKINSIKVSPSLINTSCAWSSNLTQLKELYDSPYTGAVTTRSATLDGFPETESNTVAFTRTTVSTINSFGYSPHPLAQYLSWVETILTTSDAPKKPFIVSIAASDPTTLRTMVQTIQSLRTKLNDTPELSTIAIELNTSCPNIHNAPPTGYTFPSLLPLLTVLKEEYAKDESLTIGLKLPPFVHRDQFLAVLDGIKDLCIPGEGDSVKCPFAFFTSTNTLGNSLLFPDQTDGEETGEFAVPTALGGVAGDALHALSLGNVYTFSQLLNNPENALLKGISIIGAGGVTSKEAAERMRKAGAAIVGSATLFGKEGVRAFEIIAGN